MIVRWVKELAVQVFWGLVLIAFGALVIGGMLAELGFRWGPGCS